MPLTATTPEHPPHRRQTVELAVVTALPQECAAVYAALGLPVPHVTPGWRIAPPAACVDAGLPETVAIVCTGAGKVSAAGQLTRFLESVTPRVMVCGGIAGGVNPTLAEGDSIIAERCWFYDRDATAAGISFGSVSRNEADRYDLGTAAAAARATRFPVATIATGDSVVTPELCRSLPAAWRERLRSSDVVDMESAVWVEVAGLYGIVPIICRTVFDLVACADLHASEPGASASPTASRPSISFHAACHRAGVAIAETVRTCGHGPPLPEPPI